MFDDWCFLLSASGIASTRGGFYLRNTHDFVDANKMVILARLGELPAR